MKKAVFFLGAGLSISFVSKAQVSFSTEAGINVSAVPPPTSNLEYENNDAKHQPKIGATLGVNMNIPISPKFYFEPGLFYTQVGSNTRSQYYDRLQNTTFTDLTKQNIHYLRLNLNMGYNIFSSAKYGKLFVTAGPYVSVPFYTNSVGVANSYEQSNRYQLLDQSNTEGIKPFDVGFNVGIGYQFKNNSYIRIQYAQGLTNVSGSANAPIRNNGCSITYGYTLNQKRKKK